MVLHVHVLYLLWLCAAVHVLCDAGDLVKVREGHGLELGVDEDAVDLDLEGGAPAHHALDVGAGNLLPDLGRQLLVARAVASSAAVLYPHFHHRGLLVVAVVPDLRATALKSSCSSDCVR